MFGRLFVWGLDRTKVRRKEDLLLILCYSFFHSLSSFVTSTLYGAAVCACLFVRVSYVCISIN